MMSTVFGNKARAAIKTKLSRNAKNEHQKVHSGPSNLTSDGVTDYQANLHRIGVSNFNANLTSPKQKNPKPGDAF